MATVYEIVQALSQAAANAYDGAHDADGEAIKAGLQREEGRPEVAPQLRQRRRGSRVAHHQFAWTQRARGDLRQRRNNKC